MSTNTLSEIERQILSKDYGTGNDVLYQFCADQPLQKCTDSICTAQASLAGQMWLIGRSYAASPERRNYKLGKKIHLSNSGDGLDTFFELLAKNICQSDQYGSFIKTYEGLKKCGTYQFQDQTADVIKLKDSIFLVLKLNTMVKKARLEVDKGDIEKHSGSLDEASNHQNNLISFCSKFLHFHIPNLVFIMDSITSKHFQGKTPEYQFSFSGKGDNNLGFPTVNKKEAAELLKTIYSDRESKDDKGIGYAKHAVNEYLLAKAISQAFSFEGKFIPRLVDTYMLYANSK